MFTYKSDGLCRNDEYSKARIALLLLSSCCLFACSTAYYDDGNAGRIESPQSLAVVGPLLAEPADKPSGQSSVETELSDDEKHTSLSVTPEAKIKEANRKELKKKEPRVNNSRTKEASNKSVQKERSKKPLPPVKKQVSTAPTAKPKKVETVKLSKPQVSQSKTKASQPSQAKLVSKKPTKQEGGSIDGRVVIVGDNNKLLPPKGIFLTLTPSDGRILTRSARAPVTHTIDMQDKTYLPGYISVRKNDRVSFVNKDKIKHNVFSSTGKNAFDLGTYSAGKMREVALNAPGIVKVYCNIHADMATFISVSDNSISVVANHQGHFKIEDIEPGEYNLNVWHVRGEKTEKIIKTW